MEVGGHVRMQNRLGMSRPLEAERVVVGDLG
jgi:hypothetical protein